MGFAFVRRLSGDTDLLLEEERPIAVFAKGRGAKVKNKHGWLEGEEFFSHFPVCSSHAANFDCTERFLSTIFKMNLIYQKNLLPRNMSAFLLT